MQSSRRSFVPLNAVLVAGALTIASIAATPSRRAATIPDRLADSTFWRLVSTFSEPSGTFSSENFVSNETEWQYVIPGVLDRVKSGGAYVGVGPEQNFTYIAAFHPKIAFICDIRRQNLIVQLMYKALVEMSFDRAGFLSMLWSRPRPEGLDTLSNPALILDAFRKSPPDSNIFNFNLGAIFNRLVDKHKFALSSDDSATMRAVFGVFYSNGPEISYSSRSGRGGPPYGLISGPAGPVGGTFGTNGTMWVLNGPTSVNFTIARDSTGRMVVYRDSGGMRIRDTSVTYTAMPTVINSFSGGYATFGSLMTEDDGNGVNRGWLGTEAAFRWFKDFETRNLVVPVVGNFGGSKALRAVGDYLRQNSTRVMAFYTSNVEQYLFQSRIDADFYENVATFPTDSNSIFVRSFPTNIRGAVPPRKPGSRLAQTTSSIEAIIRAYRAGMLQSYADLAVLQDR